MCARTCSEIKGPEDKLDRDSYQYRYAVAVVNVLKYRYLIGGHGSFNIYLSVFLINVLKKSIEPYHMAGGLVRWSSGACAGFLNTRGSDDITIHVLKHIDDYRY